jgi:hypothetical protein
VLTNALIDNLPASPAQAPQAAAAAFSHTFWVAAWLVTLTLIPAFFLPRRREESRPLDKADEAAVPPMQLH